ncbi:far upstream element-binding protein 1 [Coffea eugenioides]|uniref:K Homology domain-containing protein n=1 Tax=Coffea arabica TaxID=13443 RepID=A0A6P6TST5_COFAR|nr:far upstream element-binding protein 1-like [Coffea arabica]XP_027181092.1 far upstream element-binding protein 1 [Coffea eugenioides]
MAEELQYGSDSLSNKRKYEDSQAALPSRSRPTGFSAPISSQSPPDSKQPPAYNTVPPPMDEIQLAKQKAQEIAARLFNNVDPSKKPRVDNGGSGGYDSIEPVVQKPLSGAPSVPSSYGYPGLSKKIEIPNGRVGVIIGKGGETIKYLQLQSGAKIQVTRDMDADPHSLTRGVELMGTPDQITKAEQLINDVLNEADAGGSGIVSRRVTGQPAGADQFVMQIPNNKVGLVIGKGGDTIKNMQARTGARIQVIPLHLPPGDTSTERTLQIDGTSEQIEAAKQLVNEVIAENRMRNSSMGGGYPQQGYQARPPASWAPPGPPMQQPGYGYLQPGAYPGPAPQYNMNQPPYPGYPPQPTSGGYTSGWDQTTAPSNQQNAQGGGYDYYSQQQPPQQQQAPGGPGGPTDNSAYGYNQAPASGYSQGQGYPQDGYGGYQSTVPQSGYAQSQPNAVPGYDQQQGYHSASGYGSVSNPPTDGHTPSYGTQADASQAPPVQSSATGQQGYAAGQQPSPNPNYPPQGAAQPGYGVPPTSQAGYGTQQPSGYGSSYGPPQTQKPPTSQPAYGQTQQSPTAQGGYGQPGYPPAQSGYGPPSTGYGAPASQPGYGAPASQSGYGAPPYGGPPASQSNYGQQATYSSAYSGGYSNSQQPPAYSSDGSSGGNPRGAYDSTTASQASQQPSGVSKASPQE